MIFHEESYFSSNSLYTAIIRWSYKRRLEERILNTLGQGAAYIEEINGLHLNS